MSKIVTEVDELKVSGFDGSKSSAFANTVEDAGKFTDHAKFFVAFASKINRDKVGPLCFIRKTDID